MTEWDALCAIFSKPRLETYLKAANDDQEEALKLYKLNLSLSEALYPTLCILEIALRNRISSVLVTHYGETWFDGHAGKWFDGKDIMARAKPNYELEAIANLKSELLKQGQPITSDAVTSNLTFGFWTGLFKRAYVKTLWDKHITEIFPDVRPINYNLKSNLQMIRNQLDCIRDLRNRVFHHEPLFGTPKQSFAELLADCANARKLIGWLSQDALRLLDSQDRFKEIVASISPNQTGVLLPQNTRETLKAVIFRNKTIFQYVPQL